ncbi:ATP12-domain-containing protein [Guyanagaster necrorhizus]|uniref:ATP12-domain-containing protein n=1 Tax=Guyanagaster necrorhizus TaxID=856835 RepID=A0A9P7W4X3_9AGAR|nr:ATP12-domain-containing protein [Guyanagaster necrorhizus MCA 3950]KAG7452687.1 ATP12-domain-containing protein [Guyanagaster necrorhizus MCA 3950]
MSFFCRLVPIRSAVVTFPHNLRRLQSTASVIDGPPVTETNRAESTMKRFWKDVGIEKRRESFTVTLDRRALKTPSGNTLLLPGNKMLIATLVATEWDNQDKLLKPHALPIDLKESQTSLVSRAIDSLGEEAVREEVCHALLEYLDTDTICFHEDYPPQLVTLQTKHWDPLLEWARNTFKVEIHKFESILSNKQPEATKQRFIEELKTFTSWEMAAMERATYITKSFLIALALVKRFITVEQASIAARVEVSSQIERWGEVEDSHDVDFHDIRRQLGSAACLLSLT